MYSYDIKAAEIRERQDFFHQQGRIDRQARELRAAQRQERRAQRQSRHLNRHPKLTAVVQLLGGIRLHAPRTARIR